VPTNSTRSTAKLFTDLTSKEIANGYGFESYSEDQKRSVFSKWSKTSKTESGEWINNFPEEIKELVHKRNIAQGLDIEDRYGYKVVYFSYVEGESLSYIERNMKPRKGHPNQVHYHFNSKSKGKAR
jgi:hypothetical protein